MEGNGDILIPYPAYMEILVQLLQGGFEYLRSVLTGGTEKRRSDDVASSRRRRGFVAADWRYGSQQQVHRLGFAATDEKS